MRDRANVTCARCSKSFAVCPSPASRRRFCSRACKGLASRVAPNATCETCRAPFVAVRYRDERFCSRHCSASSRKILATRPCEACGADVTRQHKQFNPVYRVFCSAACESAGKSGERSHLWRGGSGDKRGPNWHRQRNRARSRDGYSCQRCGVGECEYGKQLDVHHIKPFRLFADYREANRLENLISVCTPCHRVLERAVRAQEAA